MASITRSRVNELTDKQIADVQLSNRKEYGEYVTYEALSSNGVDTYIVTLRAGVAVGCECPSNRPCKHRAAAEFQEAWDAPVAKAEQVWHDDDTAAHVADSIRSGEFEIGEMEAIADAIIKAEQARKLPAVLRDGEGLYYVLTGDTYRVMSAHDLCQIGPYREGDEQDRERLAVMLSQPVQDERERMYKAPMTPNDGFSLLAPERPRRRKAA